MDTKTRCSWCLSHDKYIEYHDHEWGVPVHDDQLLFEMLMLEGAQAGLSWWTILNKREGYREAFDNFDVQTVASYSDEYLESLRSFDKIIKNKLKIYTARTNARAFIKVQEEFGSFDKYIWAFVDGKPIVNALKTEKECPATTPLSEKISKDLKKRGFKFVGPTIVYALMQSIGMVNDHIVSCFRYKECV